MWELERHLSPTKTDDCWREKNKTATNTFIRTPNEKNSYSRPLRTQREACNKQNGRFPTILG